MSIKIDMTRHVGEKPQIDPDRVTDRINFIAKRSDLGMLRSMDWQETTALAIVVVTASAFAWARFRPRRFSFHRDSQCGCSTSASSHQPSSIVLRARKGA